MSAVVYHRRAEVAKRIIWAVMILTGIGLLALLYSFKTMAQSARKDVSRLEAQIEREESQIQLLKADIAYLERPDRLSELSQTVTLTEPLGYAGRDGVEQVKAIPLRDERPEGGAP